MCRFVRLYILIGPYGNDRYVCGKLVYGVALPFWHV